MHRRTRRIDDPEEGERPYLGVIGGFRKTFEFWSAMNNSSDGPAQSERRDFDDGANALWYLYSKKAQTHDEALFQGLLADMNGIPTFLRLYFRGGLFAAVTTSFLVDCLKNLQPDPTQQSIYYQQQSVAMFAKISQQIAPITPQVFVPSTPPPPYPAFYSPVKEIRVNAYGRSVSSQVFPVPHPSRPLDRAAVVTCNDHSYFENEEARRKRMRACFEAVLSISPTRSNWKSIQHTKDKLVSEIGYIENLNQSPTSTPDPSFILPLDVSFTRGHSADIGQQTSQGRAKYAMGGLMRIQLDFGRPDEAALMSAQRIDECLKTAWEFEVAADGMKDVDPRISIYQDAIDDATYKLTWQLFGVSFDEPHQSESFLLSDTFHLPTTGSTSVTPQFIFPGQRVQALARLGLKLREVLDGRVAGGYEDDLNFAVPARQFDGTATMASARSTRRRWSWVHRRAFLPLPETTFIDTFIARIE
ncbi:hypothetical protein EDB89DRAFT_2191835 [Lactarius sanguifluus]|nr:hypothetical protein EDB89DRAFT_2191835 [Lactarius sanguifluus]